MPKTQYDPLRGAAIVEAFRLLSGSGAVSLNGIDAKLGALAALVDAEFLAARAGVVPMVRAPDGTLGIIDIGGARRKILDPAKWHARPPSASVAGDVATVYLGVHGAVRGFNAFARVPGKHTPRVKILGPNDVAIDEPTAIAGTPRSSAPRSVQIPPATIGAVPAAAVVIVLGLAAIISAAWYATHTRNVETEAERAVDVHTADALARLATKQLETTGEIQPDLVSALAGVAKRERHDNWTMPIALGATGLGITIAAAWGLSRAFSRDKGKRAA